MRYRPHARSVLLALSMWACARGAAAPAPTASTLVYARPAPATTTTADAPATLLVRLRSAEHPTRTVTSAGLRLYAAGADTTRPAPSGAFSDSSGAATVEGLRAGAYTLHAMRIGYAPLTVPLALPAGCTVTVELYLQERHSCLFHCPTLAARAVVTTCARRAV